MVKYRQAVAIIGNAPPVRFSYPPIAKLGSAQQLTDDQSQYAVSDSPDAPVPFRKTDSPDRPHSNQTGAPFLVDSRRTVSFGQMMNTLPATVPAEYDPDKMPEQGDPCFADALDRIEFER